jgi:hypothetical protein
MKDHLENGFVFLYDTLSHSITQSATEPQLI